MLLWGILCALVGSGILVAMLLLPARQRRALPLYVQVEDDAENIEWLLLALLRKAPRRQLLIIDYCHGENRRILRALSRRYHLAAVTEVPPGAPLLYVRHGVTVCDLLQQYEHSQQCTSSPAQSQSHI